MRRLNKISFETKSEKCTTSDFKNVKIFYEKNFKYYGSQLLSDTREILLYISKKIMDVRAFLENLNF